MEQRLLHPTRRSKKERSQLVDSRTGLVQWMEAWLRCSKQELEVMEM
jgi:hypothetical protein